MSEKNENLNYYIRFYVENINEIKMFLRNNKVKTFNFI